MSRYLSSQYLADSSLSQDAHAVFAPDHRALSALSHDSREQKGRGAEADGGGSGDGGGSRNDSSSSSSSSSSSEQQSAASSFTPRRGAGSGDALDLDVVLAQPAMPVLLYLVDRLEEDYGKDTRDQADMPKWQKALFQLLDPSKADADQPFPHINVRWSIVKLVLVKWQVFAPWASSWWRPLAQLALADNNGGVGFHYQLRDVCVTLLRWNAVPADTAEDRRLGSNFLGLLMANSADHGRASAGKRAKLRSNVQIVRLFVERWKARVTVDKQVILSHLTAELESGRTGGAGAERRQIGMQLLSILASQSLLPYDPVNDGSRLREEQLVDALIDNVRSGKKALYEPAAEVFGIIVKANAALRHDNRAWMTGLRAFLEPQLSSEKQRVLVLDVLCKAGLHAHQLGLLSRAIIMELLRWPYLTNGAMQAQLMQLLLWSAQGVTGVYDELLTNGWLERILRGADAHTQELTLMVLLHFTDEITAAQVRVLLPRLTATFAAHSSEQCRALYYKFVIYLREQHVAVKEVCSSDADDALAKAVSAGLITGLSESSPALRSALFAFFDRALPAELPARLMALLTTFHQPDPSSVGRWLSACVALLLQPMSRSSDFSRPISDMPLQECRFTTMDIWDDLQSNTAAFTPLFSASQMDSAEDGDDTDGGDSGSMVDDSDSGDGGGADSAVMDEDGGGAGRSDGAAALSFHPGVKAAPDGGAASASSTRRRRGRGGIRATQAAAFPVTQSLLTMDMSALMDYNLSQQSQSEYLFFHSPVAGATAAAPQARVAVGSLADFQLMPQQRLAARRQQLRGAERGSVKSSTRVTVGNEELQLRFRKYGPARPFVPGSSQSASAASSSSSSSSSASSSSLSASAGGARMSGSEERVHWAAFHDRRAKDAQLLLQRTKELEAASVSLFRSYRTGELPDIQILHRELLEPLAATHQDTDMAKRLFVLLVRSLYAQLHAFMQDADAARAFRQQLAKAMLAMLQRLADLEAAAVPAASSAVYALQVTMVECARSDLSGEFMAAAALEPPKSLRAISRLSCASNNVHSAILWFEQLLSMAVRRRAAASSHEHAHSRKKRGREAQQSSASAGSSSSLLSSPEPSSSCHFQLARLYSELGASDTSLQLHSVAAHHPLTRAALHSALTQNYEAALKDYTRALDAYDAAEQAEREGRAPDDVWQEAARETVSVSEASVVPSLEEVELWNQERLDCLRGLTQWALLRDSVKADLDVESDADLPRLLTQESEERGYLDHFLTAGIKRLQERFVFPPQDGEDDGAMNDGPPHRGAEQSDEATALTAFLRLGLSNAESTARLEAPHSGRLLLYFAFQGSREAPRALHYLELSHRSFLQQWEQLPPLANAARGRLLRSLQGITEVAEFIRATPAAQLPALQAMDTAQRWALQLERVQQQLDRWAGRLPSHTEELSSWDDVLLNRGSFLLLLYAQLQDTLNDAASHPEQPRWRAQLDALGGAVTAAVTRWLGKAAFVLAESANFSVAHKYLTGAHRFLNHAQSAMRLDPEEALQHALGRQLSYQASKLTLLKAQHDLDLITTQTLIARPEGSANDGGATTSLSGRRALLAHDLQSALGDVVQWQADAGLEQAAERTSDRVSAYRALSLKARIHQQLQLAEDSESDHATTRSGSRSSRARSTHFADAVDDLTTLSTLFAPLALSDLTQSAFSAAEVKKAGKAFLTVAAFANARLIAEESAATSSEAQSAAASWLTPSTLSASSTSVRLTATVETHLRDLLVCNVLYGMRLNERSARLLFPRALELAARCPADSAARRLFQQLTTGARAASTPAAVIPVWQFLAWIPQLLSTVGLAEFTLAAPILHALAAAYPQAVYFPFHLSRATFREKLGTGSSAASSAALDASLAALGAALSSRLIPLLLEALDGLTPPELRLGDFVRDFREAHARGQPARAAQLWSEYRTHYLLGKRGGSSAASSSAVVASEGGAARVEPGPIAAAFARKYRRPLELLFADVARGHAVSAAQLKELTVKAAAVQADVAADKDVGSRRRVGVQSLASFSGWLMAFAQHGSALHESVEVPGQYRGDAQPRPSSHVTIVNFARELRVLGSIRKPKRLTLLGSDQREYPFLLKAGEDLRLDERIEQLFGAMNDVLSSDRRCAPRHFALTTYAVVPLAPKLGWIQWLPNMLTVKEVFKEAAGAAALERSRKAMEDMVAQLAGAGAKLVDAQNDIIDKVPAARLVRAFRPVVDVLPPDLFQRFLLTLASSAEAFLVLRSRLLHSFSVMAISQWLLGIGDRHTDNFLFDRTTGRIAAIDFGMAFGQGAALRIPELVPLRFSPQFQRIAQPLDTAALVAIDMEMAMDAYHAQQQRLLTMLDVFVKEPHVEWIEQARNKDKARRAQQPAQAQEQSASSSSGDAAVASSSLSPSLSWYPREKLLIARAKLNCANPAAVTCLELNDNAVFTAPGRKAMKEHCCAIVEGRDVGSKRRAVGPYCSGVREQVDCLLEQAMDDNILGRTYVGWTPQM